MQIQNYNMHEIKTPLLRSYNSTNQTQRIRQIMEMLRKII